MSRQLPTLRPREIIRALELLVCVPVHPGDLKRPVLRSIIRQADLTVDEFLDLI